jgi:hypothetical protein
MFTVILAKYQNLKNFYRQVEEVEEVSVQSPVFLQLLLLFRLGGEFLLRDILILWELWY